MIQPPAQHILYIPDVLRAVLSKHFSPNATAGRNTVPKIGACGVSNLTAIAFAHPYRVTASSLFASV
jgi:hypothetical protein